MVSTEASTFPTPVQLTTQLPVSQNQKKFIESSKQTIIHILQGRDPRKLLVVGPCSIHDLDAAMEYAHLLHRLSQDVIEEFFIVMRVYMEKPRTSTGWKGFLFDPHLDGSHDMIYGMREGRKLLLHLSSMGIPVGSELLELSTYHYLGDLLAWGCIGARTTSSQPHRQMASNLPLPMGFKNPVDGDLDCTLYALQSASTSHTFLGMNCDGRVSIQHSKGNPHCHLILRGQQEKPNFDPATIQYLCGKMDKLAMEKKVMIDCSHDNCRKIYSRQAPVFESFVDYILEDSKVICGAMLESHLNAGCQPFNGNRSLLKYGVSITDPCLDFSSTEKLIKKAAHILKNLQHRNDSSRSADQLCNAASISGF